MKISVSIADAANNLAARNALLRHLSGNEHVNANSQPSLPDSASQSMTADPEAIQLLITTALNLATLALEFVKWRNEVGGSTPSIYIQADGRTTELHASDLSDPEDRKYIIRRALVGAPDPRKSRCVLIGISDYSGELRELHRVESNLEELRKVLLDSEVWGIPAENLRIIDYPPSTETIREAVMEAAQNASENLLIYFAGHGLCDHDDQLRLALPEATKDGEKDTVLWNDLAEIIQSSESLRKVVWLDCCYAGLAMPDSDPENSEKSSSELLGAAHVEDAYLLVATQRRGEANAADGEGCTAFTGELVNALANGIRRRSAESFVSLNSLHQEVCSALREKKLPEPRRHDPANIGALPHFHHKWNPDPGPPNRSDSGRRRILPIGRWPSRGRIWYTAGAVALALIVIAGLFTYFLTPGEKVGRGLDLAKYCSALAPGEEQRFELIGTTSCDQPVDLDSACAYSYNASGLSARFSSPSPYSAECTDPESGASYGGISDMTGYCQSRTKLPDVAATVTTSDPSSPWVCQLQINKDVACDSQNNRTDLVAVEEKGLVVCREE